MAKIILLLIFSFFSATSCNEKNEDKTSNYQSLENNPPPIVKDVKSSKNIELKKEKIVIPTQDLSLDNTCQLNKNLELKNKRNLLKQKYGNYNIFVSELIGGHRTFKINDLVDNHFETYAYRSDINSKNFQAKMMKVAIEGIIKNQSHYYGILKLEDINDSQKELLACLKEDPILEDLQYSFLNIKNHDSQELYKNFLIDNLIYSFKAKFLWNQVEKIKKEMDVEIGKILINSIPMKHGNYSYRDLNRIEKIKERYQIIIDEKMAPIGQMISEAPMLFDFRNDFSLTNWVNIKIEPSQIMLELTHGFSSELISELEKAYNKNKTILAFKDILLSDEYNAFLNSYAQTKIKDQNLKQLFKEKLTDYIIKSNTGGLNICENKGQNLHHSDDIVSLTLHKNAGLSNYHNIMSRDTVGFCYLKENFPDKKIDTFTWKTGVGFLSIGIGTALQIFVGPGTATGIALIGAGGAIITGETYFNSKISYKKEMEARTLNYAGWKGFREVIELAEQTQDLKNNVGTDLALSVIGAGSGKLVQYAGKVKGVKEEDLIKSLEKSGVKVSDYQRGSINQSLIESGSEQAISTYKKLIWQRHKMMWKEFKTSDQRFKILNKREFYRVRNRNKIPAHYLYGKSGEETYGILDIIKDAKRLDTDEGQEALSAVEKWIKNYETYKSEIDKAVDLGFQAKKQLSQLEKIKNKYSPKDFFGGQTKTIKITKIVDGRIIDNAQESFETYYDLQEYIRKQNKLSKTTFARNSLEELMRESDVYKIMDEQAIDYRKLEFLRDHLRSVSSPNEKQKDLLQTASKLLEKEELLPRPDALIRLQKKELWAERADFIRGMKSKEKLLEKMHFKLSDSASNSIKQTGPVGQYFKTVMLITFTGATGTAVKKYTDTGGTIDEIGSKIKLASNEVIKSFNGGYTGEERDCAEEARSFSFMICFNKLVKTELGVERARAIIKDDTYSFHNDSEAVKKVLNLTYRILKLRKKLRGAELFVLGNSILEMSYSTHAKQEIIDLISKTAVNKPELATKMGQIIFAKSKDEADEYLHRYENELGTDFTLAARYIISNPKELAKAIKDSARLPQELELIIRGLDLEEADQNIINDNIFNITVEMLEQAKKDIDYEEIDKF